MSEQSSASAANTAAGTQPVLRITRLPFPTLEYNRGPLTTGRSLYTVQVQPLSYPTKSSDPLSDYTLMQLYLPSVYQDTAPHNDSLYWLDRIMYLSQMRDRSIWPSISQAVQQAWDSLSARTRRSACDETRPESGNARMFCISRLSQAAMTALSTVFDAAVTQQTTLKDVPTQHLPFLGETSPQWFDFIRRMPQNQIITVDVAGQMSVTQAGALETAVEELSLAADDDATESAAVESAEGPEEAETSTSNTADASGWVTFQAREGRNPFSGSKTPRRSGRKNKTPRAPWE